MKTKIILPLHLCLIGLAACATPPHPIPAAPVFVSTPATVVAINDADVEARVTISAVGDILFHGAVKKSAAAGDVRDAHERSLNHKGYDSLFADVSDLVKSADFSFANLESPVAPVTGAEGRPFVFNAPAVALPALKNLGLDLVSVANNHIFDQGVTGLAETIDQLKKVELPFVGIGKTREEARIPAVLNARGIRIAFLGYADFFNTDLNDPDSQKPHANQIDETAMITDIKRAKERSDFVVLSLHWGNEYQAAPTARQKELARRLFEAGASVILGHHPHILQPIELVKTSDGRNCFVVYSLGNFISNQSQNFVNDITPADNGDTRDSAILFFDVVKRNYGSGVIKIELSQLRYHPIWTENVTPSPSTAGVQKIRVISIDQTITAVKKQLGAMPLPKDETGTVVTGTPEEKTYVELSRFLKNLRARRAVILDRLGEDFAVTLK